MEKKEWVSNSLEQMRSENLILRNSAEYRIGTKICNLLNDVKKFQIIKAVKREVNYCRISKYNCCINLPSDNFAYGTYPKENFQFVIYTCITGGYDKLQEPLFFHPSIKYVAFTDDETLKSDNWEIRMITKNFKDLNNNILINRYFKFHPQEFFGEFDYSIYIDGNLRVLSDLRNMINRINNSTGLAFHRHNSRNCVYKEVEVCHIEKRGNITAMRQQVDRYKKEGFPENFGLYEANVILSDNRSESARKILDSWWEVFVESGSFRDQIALPYVIWKNGYKFDDIGNLGFNMHHSPKLLKISHM